MLNILKVEKKVGTIKAPIKPDHIPNETQWLSGQGGGTWFCVNETDKINRYQIKRYAPNGDLDCDRIFEIEENGSVFDIQLLYEFVHISHCAKCRIKQDGIIFIFNY